MLERSGERDTRPISQEPYGKINNGAGWTNFGVGSANRPIWGQFGPPWSGCDEIWGGSRSQSGLRPKLGGFNGWLRSKLRLFRRCGRDMLVRRWICMRSEAVIRHTLCTTSGSPLGAHCKHHRSSNSCSGQGAHSVGNPVQRWALKALGCGRGHLCTPGSQPRAGDLDGPRPPESTPTPNPGPEQ